MLQLVNQYKSNQHTFGLGLKVSSGLPYSILTDFKITSMQGQALEYQGEYDGINGNRLPYNYELNFSYEYRFNIIEGMRGYISGSIRNILNQENIFERNYSVIGSESNPPEITFSDKANLKFTPNISARIEW